MPRDSLDEREFELVNIIGAELAANQRDLSHHMDISLGTINMLLRRLIAKGFIRIEQLDKRKVRYILTPQGFAEKMRKSVKYTIKTIHSIKLIKESLKRLVVELYNRGERDFFILGESDLALLVERAFKENKLLDCNVHHLHEVPLLRLEGTLLICKENEDGRPHNVENAVNVITELAKDESVIINNINNKTNTLEETV